MRAEWKRHLGSPFLRIYPGQLVKGEVVKVTPSFAYVHVGYKCEGEVRLDEVLLEDEEAPKKGLKAFFSVGDEIFSEVIKVSDDELVLSLQTLRRIAAWEKLLALERKDRPLRATVLHVHRGTLFLRCLFVLIARCVGCPLLSDSSSICGLAENSSTAVSECPTGLVISDRPLGRSA